MGEACESAAASQVARRFHFPDPLQHRFLDGLDGVADLLVQYLPVGQDDHGIEDRSSVASEFDQLMGGGDSRISSPNFAGTFFCSSWRRTPRGSFITSLAARIITSNT